MGVRSLKLLVGKATTKLFKQTILFDGLLALRPSGGTKLVIISQIERQFSFDLKRLK